MVELTTRPFTISSTTVMTLVVVVLDELDELHRENPGQDTRFTPQNLS